MQFYYYLNVLEMSSTTKYLVASLVVVVISNHICQVCQFEGSQFVLLIIKIFCYDCNII